MSTATFLNQMLALAISALCGVAIPALVDLLTKSNAPRPLKATIAALLSAAAGTLATVNVTAGVHWQVIVLGIATAFVTAMAAHSTGYSDPIQHATANFGLSGGSPAPAEPLSATQRPETDPPGVTGPANSGG